MGKLADEFIEEVRQAADIVAVVSEYVTLKRTGANFQARCPFHNEKTPSFSVSPQRQIFKCFGCGKAGNVFTFMMEIASLTFPESVIKLAEKHGIPVSEPTPESEERRQSRNDLLDLMRWASDFFQRQLAQKHAQEARKYLKDRGFTPEIVEKFQLGFAPASFDSLLSAALREKFSKDLLEQGGLVAKSRKQADRYYDRFRNRVIFPIWNIEGEVVAFGGRVLSPEDKPKYLNSPETPVFFKRKTMYALNFARSHLKEGTSLLLMEGYTDVIMAHQCDFPQAIATLGTSLTEDHTRIIRRYTDSVNLIFDGDAAGQNAMSRSLPHFFNQGLQVRIAVLPGGIDPCDLLAGKGQEDFRKIIDKAEDFLDFQIRKVSVRYDLQSTGGRRTALLELKKTVEQIPDLVTRRLFITKLGEFFKVPPDLLASEMRGQKTRPAIVSKIDVCRQHLQKEDEEFLLWVALHFPGKRAEILACYQSAEFETPGLADLALAIAQCEDTEIDIAQFSTGLEPESSRRLVDIYYREQENQEQVENRLKYIFKAISRKKRLADLNRLRKMMTSASEKDEDARAKILQDAYNLCKKD